MENDICAKNNCKTEEITNKDRFNYMKNQLIENLKKAFRVELTTIPLYLTAMYTAPDKAS